MDSPDTTEQGALHILCVFVSEGDYANRLCTTRGAVQVLDMLYTAHFQTARGFTIHPIYNPILPITFMIVAALSGAQVMKIGAIADTTIVV